ncbi:MAG: phosphatidate cytidylyltransferase [Alkalispirochaeta sp.]|jgi:dolichol kinase
MMEQVLLQQRIRSVSRELQTELIRKSLHLSIALVPTVVRLVGTPATMALLALGTLFYTYAEVQRNSGVQVPVISRITELASRERDLNRFVLGPITLGIGAMLALLLYPDPAASIAIYALAFGDGLAGLVGKFVGRVTLPATGGKTLEGSLACAAAVAVSSYAVLPIPAVVIATTVTATLLEVLPSGDADNLILPVGVGLAVSLFV